MQAVSKRSDHAGVLFYGDQAAHGLKASDHVQDLHSKEQLNSFINRQPSNVLTVVDVSLQNSKACIRIFPAVLALAKNFTGFAHFARIIADESEEMQQVLQEHKIVEVSLKMQDSLLFCLPAAALALCLRIMAQPEPEPAALFADLLSYIGIHLQNQTALCLCCAAVLLVSSGCRKCFGYTLHVTCVCIV